MRAIVYHGPKDVRVDSVPDPALREETDVVLRVTRTAICGSDLHVWHGAGLGASGFTLGHEFVGVVLDVGRAVQTVKRGDRVLACCTVGCGACGACRRGLLSGCTRFQAGPAGNVFGFSHELPGGQAEAVRVPYADANLFAIPSALDDEQALFLTDILPTGALGAELAEVSPGDTVVVFGCGPVGTFAQRAAQLRGAARVIAVDLDEERLAGARSRGCETVRGGEDAAARLLETTRGGADCVIEAVGRPELVQQALFVARPGGRIAVIGVILQAFEILWPLAFAKNLSLRTGLVNPQTQIPKLMPLIEQGRLDPTEIITHRLPLDDGARAYEIFAHHRDHVLKVVLSP
jgi:2-desacetyl-2-hydroxyethyl bacteriochlorophyllide A dehydrogenase